MTHESRSPRGPIAKTEMLVRKPVAEVFSAFVEPDALKKFWLYRSSAALSAGARVRWDFIVHGAYTDVEVKEFSPDERIVIGWSGGETVVFEFVRRGADQTFVSIQNYDFAGAEAEIVEKALDATGGFTIVLCELKAWLERGAAVGYGPDKFPDARLNVERRPVNAASVPIPPACQ